MLRIGVTGGIGSGKSTVAALLVQQGDCCLVDLDAIAKELTCAGGVAIPLLRNAFGPEMITADGSLDRGRVQTLVFSDTKAKHKLEQILHPLIEAEATRRELAATGRAVVFDVPLLIESSQWLTKVGWVLVVDCLESTQIGRVVCRSGWTEGMVRAVIAHQATRESRRQHADAVIYNDGITLTQLAEKVRTLGELWLPAT